MTEVYLTNFFIVISVQLLFFLIHYIAVERKHNLLSILLKGIVIGVPFGILFDLLIGNYAGIFKYHLGFEVWFLIINGLLSYGVMVANVFLLHNHSLKHALAWSVALACTYELTNYFFPVWEWTFSSTILEYVLVIFFAYFGLTLMIMACLRTIFKEHFFLIRQPLQVLKGK